MKQELIEKNYLIIKDFISCEQTLDYANQFREYAEKYYLKDDPQVSGCISKYDFIPFVELLVEKTGQVGRLIEESVLPTYTYARIYKKGNVLNGHVDKSPCEISLTVNLEYDKPWDIWIETPNGEIEYVTLTPGDAMVYLGTIARHGRETFTGNEYMQVFLHYVTVNGPYVKDHYFNKSNHYVDDQLKIKEEKKELKVIRSQNPLSHYIKVYDNILTKDECNLILNEYANSREWQSARVGLGNENPGVRNCDIIHISKPVVIELNQEIRNKIDKILFNKSFIAAKKYIDEFPDLALRSDSGYDLLRYESGGFYKQHTDSYKENPRTISMSINLNDEYVGGEMAFFDREIQIVTDPGSVVVFPSNFMYPHEIMPVEEGTRYSIVTWFT